MRDVTTDLELDEAGPSGPKPRPVSSEQQAVRGRIYDPVSGWVSDDPHIAVHEARASNTFRLLHEAFHTDADLGDLSSADTL